MIFCCWRIRKIDKFHLGLSLSGFVWFRCFCCCCCFCFDAVVVVAAAVVVVFVVFVVVFVVVVVFVFVVVFNAVSACYLKIEDIM